MKIAIVIPYLVKIEGNKTALILASKLAQKNNEVIVVSYSAKLDIIDEIRSLIFPAKFFYIKGTNKKKYGIIFALKYQLFKGVESWRDT